MTSFEVLLIIVLVASFSSLENRIERQLKPSPPPFIPQDEPEVYSGIGATRLKPGEKSLGDILAEELANCP